MKRFSYREQDYAFGKAMLTNIGLTQAGLAELLGVSRRAIGKWEAGGAYPKVEHLKALLAFALKQQAFDAGHEEEEIRAFWKTAHQKVLLDESWLSTLVSQHHRPLEPMVPPSIEVTSDSTPALAAPASRPRVEWGEALDVPSFYGREGELATLFDIDWSPDGRQLASGGTDTLVIIWYVNGRTQPRALRGHSGVVTGVGWSPDGRWLASSAWDDVISLWNPTSGACVERQQDPDEPNSFFSGAAWSPDGQCLASGTYLHGVLVWEMTAHRRRWIGRQLQAWIRHVSWSPDGTRLAGGGDDGHVYVWDAKGGTLLQRMQGHHGGVTSLAWNSDGTRLASGSSGRDSGELFVWEVQSGERVRALEGHSGMVSAVTWGPRGDLLISGGGDGVLRWWVVHSGECVRVREAHQGTVQALKVSPDGSTLASCGDDGAITLWNLENGEHVRTLRRDRPYERLDITGVKGLSEAQKATLRALGAREDAP